MRYRKHAAVIAALIAIPVLLLVISSNEPQKARATVSDLLVNLEGSYSPLATSFNSGSASFVANGYGGGQAVRATASSGGYARVQTSGTTGWVDGDEVWFGAAFNLPSNFNGGGYTSILRADNWPTFQGSAETVGIERWSGGGWHVTMGPYNGSNDRDLVGSFSVPFDRWVWIELHLKLSNAADGLTEVYIDGNRLAQGTGPNTLGRRFDRLRAGVVALASSNTATVTFDRFSISRTQRGPLGAPPPPPPPPPPPGAIEWTTTDNRTAYWDAATKEVKVR